MPFSAPLPPTRATGDPGPAPDINLLTAATNEIRTAVDTKAPLTSPAFSGTPTGITKTHVGLGNVDNTADASKPVSSAQQTALDAKAPKAELEGLAPHDGSAGGGTRPTGYLRVRWVGGSTRPTNMLAGDIWERDA